MDSKRRDVLSNRIYFRNKRKIFLVKFGEKKFTSVLISVSKHTVRREGIVIFFLTHFEEHAFITWCQLQSIFTLLQIFYIELIKEVWKQHFFFISLSKYHMYKLSRLLS